MKHKTSELEGPFLDAAVAKAEGLVLRLNADGRWQAKGNRAVPWYSLPKCSSEWAVGGPIIEREIEEISRWPQEPSTSLPDSREWMAAYRRVGDLYAEIGPTPLIAAMRAYCASVFGDEVELP